MQLIFRQLFDAETSTYTYVLGDPWSREAVVIDPVVDRVQRDLTVLNELGLELKYVVETHIHADHVTSAAALRGRTGCRVAVGAATGAQNADIYLEDGSAIRFGLQALEIRSTPGHTSGCISLVAVTQPFLFSGDTLMIRGCGRTDFQSGCAKTLYRSVRDKLFSLADHTHVYPAHDYKGRTSSTIGEERLYNPRLGQNRSEDEFVALMETLKLGYPRRMDQAVPSNLLCGPPVVDCEAMPVADGLPRQRTPMGAPSILPVEAAQWLSVARIVDIREKPEWSGLDGCLSVGDFVPAAALLEHVADWPRDEPVILVCRSGGRSDRAAVEMEGRGFRQVASLSGGLLLWRALGLPMAGDTQG